MITIDTNDNLEVTPAAFQNMKHQVEDSLVRDIKGCRWILQWFSTQSMAWTAYWEHQNETGAEI